MNEEIEKKTENQEEDCGSNGSKSVVFQIGKKLKYVVLNNITKRLRYDLIEETERERKKRFERIETQKKKKSWLKTYKDHVGSSYASICTKTEIPRRTFTRWKKEDKEFRDAIFSLKEDRIEVWEDKVVFEGMNGNVPALKFLLENNHPTYSKKLKVETTYTGDKTLEDLIAEDEQAVDDHNKKVDESNKEKIQGQPVVHSEHPEDKKQEGEDSPISA